MKYNLSTICRTANGFRKAGYSRSTAFVLAWRLAKETAQINARGTTCGNSQAVLEAAAKADKNKISVELRREPKNAHDANAVAVLLFIGTAPHKIGYLPAAAASLIAPLIDAGQTIKAALKNIVGGWAQGINYGAQITLAI